MNFAYFQEHPSYTREEFNELADKFSAFIPPKSKVAIVSNTSPHLLACILGCWKVGAMAVPLRFDGTLAEKIEELNPDIIFYATTHPPVSKGILLSWVDLWNSHEKYPSKPQGDFPALCIFTSGSTGKPKGVVLSMDALIAGKDAVVRAFTIEERNKVLCTLPMHHLNGLMNTFIVPWYTKSEVAYYTKRFETKKVLEFLRDTKCNWVSGIPSLYAKLLAEAPENPETYFNSVMLCRSASAPLDPVMQANFENKYGTPILDTMGMTETAGQILVEGHPINCEVKVNNGELFVKSNTMMIGYLNEEPFTDEWLATGDLAVRNIKTTRYEITGRKKNIAIFLGVNISIDFINEKLGAHGYCKPSPHPIYGEVLEFYVDDAEAVEKIKKYLPRPKAVGLIHITERNSDETNITNKTR